MWRDLLRSTALFCAVALISFLCFNHGALALTFTVTNTNDAGAGSLRDAIDMANANMNGPGVVDEIVFAADVVGVIPSTVGFSAEMEITDDITITGPGSNLLTIDAQTLERIFLVDDGDVITDIVVAISGLRFINGDSDNGGAIFNAEDLSIDSCEFESNDASGEGGAIYNDGELSIDSCVFESNEASDNGGAIHNEDGSTITTISNSTFYMNEAFFTGGAINNEGLLENIINCTFEMNDIFLSGGAIFNFGNNINKIENSRFIGNNAEADGGAIWNNFTIGEITQSTFSGNMAPTGNGGAIFSSGPMSSINVISHSTFSGNMVDMQGGAIYNFSGDISTITSSTFVGNSAGTFGGAIFHESTDTLDIINSTFSENMAQDGGAIYSSLNMNIAFSTIANNSALNGGGIFLLDGLLNIKNSIVGNSTGGGDCVNSGGVFIAIGENLDTDGSCVIAAGGIGMGFTEVTSLALNLGVLQDNGGPTETIELLAGSAAIDTTTDCTDLSVIPLTVISDQRFFPRPSGTECDTGAFEEQPIGRLTIVKETDPAGGSGFEFNGTGFPFTCELADTFMLDHTESATCIVPAEDLDTYNVTENPPPGQLPDITCDDGTPQDSAVGVTVDIDDGANVTCTFLNLVPSEVKITKFTVPPSGDMFDFVSTGFDFYQPCDIASDFMLSNQQMASCLVFTDDFTVSEAIPDDQVLNIFCEDLPAVFDIDIDTDNSTGTLSFTIADLSENVDCVFVNSPANTVVRVMDEPEGMNCEFGGQKIETGTDTNQNGMLEDEEVDDMLTAFVCNGAQGSLVRVTPEPVGPDCEFGGQKIETGVDDNNDGELQDGEVDDTVFVCNGAPGLNTLVLVTPEDAGDNCEFGGQKVDSGVDDNMNEALDPGEIDNTFFVCNGEVGPQGPGGPAGPPGDDAVMQLVEVRPLAPGPQCPNGGIIVITGPDLNDNGTLEDNEIETSQVVCDGTDGSDGSDGQDGSNGNNGCSISAGPEDVNNLLLLLALPFTVILVRRLSRSMLDE